MGHSVIKEGNMNDNDALEGLRNGDEGAFAWIYRTYRYDFLKSMEGKGLSEEESRALYQDCILELRRKVMNSSLTESRGGGLGGWLYRCGRNKIKEGSRRRDQASSHEIPDLPEEEEEDWTEEKLEQLKKAMEKLGERDCLILDYYYLKDLSLEQIEKKMGFSSYKAAAMALSRARDRLRLWIFNPKNNL